MQTGWAAWPRLCKPGTVQGDVQVIIRRVDAVAARVTKQMQDTIAMLTKIANKYDTQQQESGKYSGTWRHCEWPRKGRRGFQLQAAPQTRKGRENLRLSVVVGTHTNSQKTR